VNSVEIEVEAVCGKCGQQLDGSAENMRGNWGGKILVTVQPCERCMKEEYIAGEEAVR
jgi:C4-type Zn-finger protein